MSRRPVSLTTVWISLLVAGLFPLLIGLRVHGQGFNLMDDGLWLLSARVYTDGGQLYRDIFQIYGPARSFLLAPFLLAFGESVAALAIFKAVLDGVAGVVGYQITRRLGAGRWAWLVPLGVIALGPVYPRYVAAGIFAAIVSAAVKSEDSRWRGGVVGLSWGGLSLFGLDMWAYGLLCLVGTALFARGMDKASWPPWFAQAGIGLKVGGGWLAVIGPCFVIAWLGGYFQTMWWDTVAYPVTRFGAEMGRSWWTIFQSTAQVSQPFSGLFTGEVLPPIRAGHGAVLSLAWRGLYGAAWLLPVAGLIVVWRRKEAQLLPFVLVAWASWSTLLGRGDLDHLRLISWLLLLVLPPLLARVVGRRSWQVVAVVMCLVILGPRFGERLWLAGHLERLTLVKWERESTGIWLSPERRQDLERVWQESGWDGHSPVVAWPAQPGLVFAMAAPLASPQMTLLAGEAQTESQVVDGLKSDPAQVIILGRSAGLVQAVRGLRSLAPEVYSHLRREYQLTANVKGSEAVFRILHPAAGSVQDLPLAKRLPGDSQYLRTGTTPIMAAGTSVAQTVHVADFDLSGIAVLIGSPGPWPQTIDLTVQIVGLKNGVGDALLATIPFAIVLEQQVERVELPFKPVPETEGREVIVDIMGNQDGLSPFTLFWHVPGPEVANPVDYYPAGRAFWNHEPVAGDLFFAIY